MVFATQVKRKSLRTRTVFILNQWETACMLGFRMPFFSYRSASGALRWTEVGSVLQGLIANNRQIGFRRRAVACKYNESLAHPRDTGRWATVGCSEVESVGAGEASGMTSRRFSMMIRLSAVPTRLSRITFSREATASAHPPM